jgi:hypothetical protein
MREFIASNIYQWDSLIEGWMDQTDNKPAGTLIPKKEARLIYKLLTGIIGNQCEEMGWEEAQNRVSNLELELDSKFGKRPRTAESVNRALFELKLAILNELDTRKFVMIEKRKCDFLEQKNLFGKQVSKTFPSARDEIRLAGNCLAADLNTAAVFYLMRAAEVGMRALAVRLKVKLKQKSIEHGGWNELIVQIEKKIRLRRERYDKSRTKNKKELEFQKFCRMMADELFIFKEIWRNNTMHSISHYWA